MTTELANTTDPGFVDDLVARGLIQDSTDREQLTARLAASPITVYAGFDPTANSLHAGNLVGLLMLRRFQDAGHHVLALAGGATGMVGDPSGRSVERNLQDDATVAANLAGIMPQLRQFLDFDRPGNPARLVDNRTWTVPMTFLEFLRDVGKYVTVNQMLAKDSVRARLESESGISYTEFSYMLIQANDFAWLNEHENCEMQIGGSDQWGNITAGVDMIRRRHGRSAFGLSWPLLTKADGTKYGKTAGGETMWLSPTRMSPYRFYQAWLQVEDDQVRRLLCQLTLLPVATIDEIVTEHAAAPHRREGQRRLAWEVTALVHGPEAADGAVAASEVVFGAGGVDRLGPGVLAELASEIPTVDIEVDLLRRPDNLVELLQTTGIVASRSEAGRLLAQNGIAVNEAKVSGQASVTEADLLHGEFLLVRKGKKQVTLVRVAGSNHTDVINS